MAKKSYFTTMRVNKSIIYILLFISGFGYGQDNSSKLPLIEVLTSIEKQFNVKFSYAFDDVNTIFIEAPNLNLNLSETIEYLNSKTLLNFKVLDDRYITVSVINKTISICGRIITENDRSPLFGASIVVNNTNNGTFSNTEGVFSFKEIPLNATITICIEAIKASKLKLHFCLMKQIVVLILFYRKTMKNSIKY